jgi:hypothetical protein
VLWIGKTKNPHIIVNKMVKNCSNDVFSEVLVGVWQKDNYFLMILQLDKYGD